MKIFELLTRRGDQTRAEALAYWTDCHAALVKQRMGASPLVQRYVNNVGLDVQPGRSVLPFDGVVGAWLDLDQPTFAAQVGAPGNPVVADEPNFLACKPHLMVVEELMVAEPREAGLPKLLIFLRRDAEVTFDAFRSDFLANAATATRDACGDSLAGFTINCALTGEWGPWGCEWPIYDGAIELWLAAGVEVATVLERLTQALLAVAPSLAVLQVREVVQIDKLVRAA